MNIESINISLASCISKTSKHFRWTWRRFRMRKSVKKYLNKPYKLTREQKQAAKQYWKKYSKHFSILWHELYYQKTGNFDVRYIPDDIMFTEIEDYLNDWGASRGFDNKCNYDLYFPEVIMPKTYLRRMKGIYHDSDWNIISQDEAISTVLKAEGGAIKQAQEAGYGVGVRIWIKDKDDEESLRAIIEEMKGDIIVQALIDENSALKVFKSNSVSCIRIMTFQTKESVEYVCGYLRIGQGASRTDFDGGCVCSIHDDGSLYNIGFENDTCTPIEKHENGIRFCDYKVPCYEKIKKTAIELHKKIGDFRIVSWDFSVNSEFEPVLIEVNMLYGGIMYHQLGIGPLFGKRTEKILEEVFKKDNN